MANLARKIVERYMYDNFEVVDRMVKRFAIQVEEMYNDERMLDKRVEEFLDELRVVLITGIKREIENCREEELKSVNYDSNSEDVYDSQRRKFERNLEEIFDKAGSSLEKMRMKVEDRDIGDSDIAFKTRRALRECLQDIEDEYRISSKKMENSLEVTMQSNKEKSDGFDR